ncbi:hypothetical protein [Actinoplanes sp. HUAS TT8]|uniref:hypothetical protein n=1 Tax=Actinoplanes sp. HUAS TT8 TaxID=3447453 RepID=UPI003F5201F9
MIRQSELRAALNAIGIDAEVQVRLAGVPMEIIGVRLDDLRGVIILALDEDQSHEATRRFLTLAATQTTPPHPTPERPRTAAECVQTVGPAPLHTVRPTESAGSGTREAGDRDGFGAQEHAVRRNARGHFELLHE